MVIMTTVCIIITDMSFIVNYFNGCRTPRDEAL